MAELTARTPCDGLLPIRIGAAELTELDAGTLTLLAPLGDAAALGAALEKAHGLAWPAPLRATGKAGARCLWFGRDQALLMGPVRIRRWPNMPRSWISPTVGRRCS